MLSASKKDMILFIDDIAGFNNGIDVQQLKSILRKCGFVCTILDSRSCVDCCGCVFAERFPLRLLLFREQKAQGAALLISTHMIDSVEDYWDVTHIMVNGRFAATQYNRPEELKARSLEDLFFAITEGGKPS